MIYSSTLSDTVIPYYRGCVNSFASCITGIGTSSFVLAFTSRIDLDQIVCGICRPPSPKHCYCDMFIYVCFNKGFEYLYR